MPYIGTSSLYVFAPFMSSHVISCHLMSSHIISVTDNQWFELFISVGIVLSLEHTETEKYISCIPTHVLMTDRAGR